MHMALVETKRVSIFSMVQLLIYAVLLGSLAVMVDGQCSVSPLCSVCDSAGRAVCGAICPKDISLPTDIHYLEVANGTCDQWAKLGLIRSEYLSNYTQVTILNLTNAHVERFYTLAFTTMQNLRQLYLPHNQIKGFTANTWNGLSRLEVLDLSYNIIIGLTSLLFSKLTSLKELNLSNNNISVTFNETALAGLSQLQTLKLSNNPIPYLDPIVFQPLTNIVTIEMNSLNLTSLTSGLFSNLRTLRNVSVSHNQLSSVADDSLSGTYLDKLDLSSNLLTAIPSTAVKNAATQPNVLNLSNNRITQISKANLTGLTGSLDLSGNPITNITRDAFDSLTLTSINLSNTGITSLDNSTAAWLGGGTVTIDLSNNNWQCDCTTLWLASLLQTKSNIISPTCTGKYAGHSLKDSWQQIKSDCEPTTTTVATTTVTTTMTTSTTSTKTTTTATTTAPTTATTPTTTSTAAPTTTTTAAPTTLPTTTTPTTSTTTTTTPTPAAKTTTTTTTTTTAQPPPTASTTRESTTDDIVQLMPIVIAVISTVAVCLVVAGIIAGCILCRKKPNKVAAVTSMQPSSMKLSWQPA